MTRNIKKTISYAIWSFLAVFFGVSFFWASVKGIGFAYRQIDNLPSKTIVVNNNLAGIISEMKVENKNIANHTVEGVVKTKTINDKVSILFVGDIMLDRGVKNSIEKNGGGDFSFIFENVGFLKKPDITFGNLEGPVSDTGSDRRNLYSFRMLPAAFEAVRKVGFDVFSVANNHMGDWGREAFEDTLFRLKNEEILVIGGGWNKADAENVKIIEKKGISFGFVGFTDVGPEWLEAGENEAGILNIKKGYLDVIKKAAKEVDYLIVSFHFGNEYQTEPNQRQKDIAEATIDAGAKIVIGHHPHVVQPIVNYHKGIIAYSLGNFIFDQYFSEETMQGMILEVIFDKNGIIEASKDYVKLNKFYQPSL